MPKLEKLLARWVSQGFINQQQANNIQQYESNQSDNSWAMYGLLVVGVVILGIGLVSLIAANWYNIPDTVKILADFAILALTAFFTVKAFQEERDLLFEILLLAFMLFCLASIGLISQIYHTGGEFYQALMFWSLITFPASLSARGKLIHMVIPFTWLAGFLIGLVCTIYNSPMFTPYINYNVDAIALTVPLLCACLLQAGQRLSLSEGYILALRWWFFISGLIALGFAESNQLTYSHVQTELLPYYPAVLMAILASIGILASKLYNNGQKIVLLLALAAFVAYFYVPMVTHDSSLIYALFTISILMLITMFVASVGQRRLFNWLLFLVGARFLILYFQALGGLAVTGVGLIFSGLMIIGVVYYWNKYRTGIAAWAERWLQ